MGNNGTAIPISAVLLWPKPNYLNPQRRTWLAPYAIALEAFTTTIVVARIIARLRRQGGRLGVDDVLIVVAWLLGIGLTTIFAIGILHFGYDRHVWDNQPKNAIPAAFLGTLSKMVFVVSTSLTKVSNLLFYVRMGQGSSNKIWIRINYAGIWFIVIYMLVFTINILLLCSPIDAAWKSFSFTYTTRHMCRAENVSGPMVGVFSVVTDVVAAVFPAFLFWDLKISRREKIGLWATFGLGFLTAGAGVARVVWLFRLSNPAPIYDLTWVGYEVFVWSITEYQLGMITACIPSLRVYVAKFLRDPMSRVYKISKTSKLSSRPLETDPKEQRSISVRALNISKPLSIQSESANTISASSQEHELYYIPPPATYRRAEGRNMI